MRFPTVIALLLLSQKMLFAQGGFQFETDKNKVVIPFQFINNLIFIPIEVNGVILNFLLDSGVDETILLSLDDKEAVSFNTIQKIKMRGLGSEDAIEGLKSSNNTLSFGGLIDRHHEVYIVLDQSFNFSSHIGIPVNGIIGYHFFKDHLIEINYDRKKIIVYKENPRIRKKIAKKFTAFAITIEKSKPYTIGAVTISDTVFSAKLLLDIGNSDALWLFQNSKNNITVPEKHFEDFLGKGFSGDINGKRAKISKFQLQDFEFYNPIISFPDSTSIKNVNMVVDRVGSIGGEILKRFTLIFDYPNNSMFLKTGRDFKTPFNYNMSGVEFQNEGLQWVQETVPLQTILLENTYDATGEKQQNNFKYKFSLKPVYTIANVRKNSPAAESGLQKGDVLISINGTIGYKYQLQEINALLKSEEGKWITMEVERNGKKLKFHFQLKSIL